MRLFWFEGLAGVGPAQAVRKSITVLQLGRAIAAITVLFSHVVPPTQALVEHMPYPVASLMEHGYLGVDFFFVLSGFIIYYTNAARHAQPGWTRQFLTSRLTRIFLPYLPIAIAIGLFHTLLPGQRMGGDPWNWFATLTLIPIGAESVIGIAWTLTYELAFYGLALLMFRSRQPLAWAALWAVAIILGQTIFGSFGSPPPLSFASILFNPINLEFVFGMFAAWAVLCGAPRGGAIFVVGATMCIGAFIADGMQRDHSWMLGLGLAVAIVPLVRAEQAGRIRVSAFSVLLGNASYAIYLIHPPVLTLTSRIVGRVALLDSWKISVVVGVFAAIGVGLAYHLIYEAPTLRLIASRRRCAAERAAAART